jgi:hypothetical protein
LPQSADEHRQRRWRDYVSVEPEPSQSHSLCGPQKKRWDVVGPGEYAEGHRRIGRAVERPARHRRAPGRLDACEPQRINTALTEIIREHGSMSDEAAHEHKRELTADKRYQRGVY